MSEESDKRRLKKGRKQQRTKDEQDMYIRNIPILEPKRAPTGDSAEHRAQVIQKAKRTAEQVLRKEENRKVKPQTPPPNPVKHNNLPTAEEEAPDEEEEEEEEEDGGEKTSEQTVDEGKDATQEEGVTEGREATEEEGADGEKKKDATGDDDRDEVENAELLMQNVAILTQQQQDAKRQPFRVFARPKKPYKFGEEFEEEDDSNIAEDDPRKECAFYGLKPDKNPTPGAMTYATLIRSKPVDMPVQLPGGDEETLSGLIDRLAQHQKMAGSKKKGPKKDKKSRAKN